MFLSQSEFTSGASSYDWRFSGGYVEASLSPAAQYNPLSAVDAGLHPAQCSCGLPHGESGGVDPRVLTSEEVTVDASVDGQAGTVGANGKSIWTADQAAEYLHRAGYSWNPEAGNVPQRGDSNPSTITYGFFNTQNDLVGQGYTFTYRGVNYGSDEYFNFAAFNEAQRTASRQAFGYWDDVAAVSFVETNSANADISMGNLANAPATQAYAYYPQTEFYSQAEINPQVANLGGDVWVSASQASNFQLQVGGYGLNTLTHEIGHAIGLAHPGNYNFGPGFAVNYANGAEYYQDARNYTIMSYWNARDIGARDFDFTTMALAYGGVPMVHDILAAQKIYGADMTTRTGNTVYGFNSNAGRDAFDFTINQAPTVAIWDAGGNDTLDASGYNTNQIIDLNPGSLSSIGGLTQAEGLALTFQQVNANRAAMGFAPTTLANYTANINALITNPLAASLTDNVGIAYGAWIENAVGGGGNDIILANAVANRINGGAGMDMVSYASAQSGVTMNMLTNQSGGGAAGDTLVSIEGLIGSKFNDSLYGNNADNTIGGGTGGADRLYGNGGIDTVTYFDSLTGVSVNLQNNVVGGGAAGDLINGFENVTGSRFDDVLNGSFGANTLSGGAGNDTLNASLGNDTLNGGAGSDTMTGGAGLDTFVFGETGGAYDIITDYQAGSDKIDLSAIDARTNAVGNNAFTFVGGAAFSGVSGQLRYSGGVLQGDTNGDGVADFSIQLGGALQVADVVL